MKAIFLLAAVWTNLCWASDYQVLGVKTDFPSAEGEAVYRDIYINMGTSQGLKPGTLLDAHRTISTVDQINQRVGKSISFRIAQLKVIHADSDVSVARVTKVLPADVRPNGAFTNVMVGDRVSLAEK